MRFSSFSLVGTAAVAMSGLDITSASRLRSSILSHQAQGRSFQTSPEVQACFDDTEALTLPVEVFADSYYDATDLPEFKCDSTGKYCKADHTAGNPGAVAEIAGACLQAGGMAVRAESTYQCGDITMVFVDMDCISNLCSQGNYCDAFESTGSFEFETEPYISMFEGILCHSTACGYEPMSYDDIVNVEADVAVERQFDQAEAETNVCKEESEAIYTAITNECDDFKSTTNFPVISCDASKTSCVMDYTTVDEANAEFESACAAANGNMVMTNTHFSCNGGSVTVFAVDKDCVGQSCSAGEYCDAFDIDGLVPFSDDHFIDIFGSALECEIDGCGFDGVETEVESAIEAAGGKNECEASSHEIVRTIKDQLDTFFTTTEVPDVGCIDPDNTDVGCTIDHTHNPIANAAFASSCSAVGGVPIAVEAAYLCNDDDIRVLYKDIYCVSPGCSVGEYCDGYVHTTAYYEDEIFEGKPYESVFGSKLVCRSNSCGYTPFQLDFPVAIDEAREVESASDSECYVAAETLFDESYPVYDQYYNDAAIPIVTCTDDTNTDCTIDRAYNNSANNEFATNCVGANGVPIESHTVYLCNGESIRVNYRDRDCIPDVCSSGEYCDLYAITDEPGIFSEISVMDKFGTNLTCTVSYSCGFVYVPSDAGDSDGSQVEPLDAAECFDETEELFEEIEDDYWAFNEASEIPEVSCDRSGCTIDHVQNVTANDEFAVACLSDGGIPIQSYTQYSCNDGAFLVDFIDRDCVAPSCSAAEYCFSYERSSEKDPVKFEGPLYTDYTGGVDLICTSSPTCNFEFVETAVF